MNYTITAVDSGKVDTYMFCSVCGRKLKVDSKFCSGCGIQIVKTPIPIPSQVASTPAQVPKKKAIIAVFAVSILAIIALIALMWFRPGLPLRGYWDADSGRGAIMFSGRNRFSVLLFGDGGGAFNLLPPDRITIGNLNGRYSITGDRIELVYADGQIVSFSFSRDGNTITINNVRFVRR